MRCKNCIPCTGALCVKTIKEFPLWYCDQIIKDKLNISIFVFSLNIHNEDWSNSDNGIDSDVIGPETESRPVVRNQNK